MKSVLYFFLWEKKLKKRKKREGKNGVLGWFKLF